MAKQFDFLVIGAGSGGIAAARRASEYGVSCAVIEHSRLGGTCVNVGCVPKKVMWTTSRIAEVLEDAPDYGFSIVRNGFDWATIKKSRDDYIARLNRIYQANLENSNVTILTGSARFASPDTLQVGDEVFRAPHILIATGSKPVVPNIPGSQYAITSDGFFEMENLPQKAVITGAGYIATEFAGMLHGLGSKVTMVLRKDQLLRGFDSSLSNVVMSEMHSSGVRFVTNSGVSNIDKKAEKLQLHLNSGEVIDQVDQFIIAIGRSPNTEGLDIEKAGIALSAQGYVETDKFQNTSAQGIYAVGDVTGRAALTPVAIAAGRHLADRLFGSKPNAFLEYDNIATVIFSHPPIATVGLSEQQARSEYVESIRIYSSEFKNMYYQVTKRSSPTLLKLITVGDDEKIVGCHIVGDYADEIIQGFAVAVKMGATKQDFDNTVAIHPTVAEELVTMR